MTKLPESARKILVPTPARWSVIETVQRLLIALGVVATLALPARAEDAPAVSTYAIVVGSTRRIVADQPAMPKVTISTLKKPTAPTNACTEAVGRSKARMSRAAAT